jgi:hypothetical protein
MAEFVVADVNDEYEVIDCALYQNWMFALLRILMRHIMALALRVPIHWRSDYSCSASPS